MFILPVKNGHYVILSGEGFHSLEPILTAPTPMPSRLLFPLKSATYGDSESQHMDYAFNVSLIRRFVGIEDLYLQIRGRKYTPSFSFRVGEHTIDVESVQTEVDAGFEGRDTIVLVEAKVPSKSIKNPSVDDFIIRQLYYPYRQWKIATGKEVLNVFFVKTGSVYKFWLYTFDDDTDYNSIRLVKAAQYVLKGD